MMKKIKKGFQYLGMRWYEFRICLKEFRHCGKLGKEAYQAFFENSMLVEVHSVEKGLGLRDTQPGHSAKPVINLLNKMFGYISSGYDVNHFAFAETFRVITAYMDFQKQFDTSKFAAFPEIERKYTKLCEKIGEEYLAATRSSLSAGSHIVTKDDMMQGATVDFDRLISSRHSIRMYDDRSIDADTLKKIIKLANKAPSACNRQPTEVYFSSNKEIVEKIDALITGSNGFKGETPNYMVVTTNRARFHTVEQFQWYINGGIYLSFLTLAMHSLGIGSCIMQWKAFHKNENELKKLLGISKTEAIIAIVGCGYYQEETCCIYAQRKSIEDTLHIVE